MKTMDEILKLATGIKQTEQQFENGLISLRNKNSVINNMVKVLSRELADYKRALRSPVEKSLKIEPPTPPPPIPDIEEIIPLPKTRKPRKKKTKKLN